MIHNIKHVVILLVIVLTPQILFAWERYDRVIAIVNTMAIVESEVNTRLAQYMKFHQVPAGKIDYQKSRMLDRFIEDAIVMEAAREEAIVISDARVITHIEKMLEQYLSQQSRNAVDMTKQISKRLEARLKDPSSPPNKKLDPYVDNFIKYIEVHQRIAFDDFFEDIRNQMRKEQVMSIAIGTSPPSKKEARDWFAKNKKTLGYEVWVKHILIKPKSMSLSGEKEANEKLTALRKRIVSGESFEALARSFSQDQSTSGRGGDFGWQPISSLAEYDPYFAGNVNNLAKAGEVSQIFKSGKGYHIVKYMGRKDITYEKMENLIMYKLYLDKMNDQFKKWIQKRKNESEIQIFLENYIKS